MEKQIDALYKLIDKIFGSRKLEKKVEKMKLDNMIRSNILEERVLALHKIIFEDDSIQGVPRMDDIPEIMNDIEEEISEILARRTVETRIQRQIAEKLEKRQHKYMEEMKLQILKKNAGPENANTLKKYAILENKENKKLSHHILDLLRPSSIDEIVGQQRAIKALISKLASPYPQHILIYGPPGIGKTTAARLVLEMAKSIKYTPFRQDAPFIEVDGTTLRWDPREITNPLLGSVHDPIYQGSKRELAETGIPEPKTGLVTDAHGGVLFIDEIGELDLFLQNKLLKVLEEKRVRFDSSYYDPDDDSIPRYIKKLFDEGAPADFILIGATTRQPEDINPALRSRAAEVFFEPLTVDDIQRIVINAADKLNIILDEDVPELISRYTFEGRKAVNMLADAYGMALYAKGPDIEVGKLHVTAEDVFQVVRVSRLTPYEKVAPQETAQIGKIFGLGVSGYMGSIIEFESIAFSARNKGEGDIRFNDTAGSMTKDSVINAASVIRKLTGEFIGDYDIHVNSIGGGNIDGPSAGAAICLVILSALKQKPIRQDIAVTGEISIQGNIKPVGGIFEKIYGASRAGIKKVVIPFENKDDVPEDLEDIEIITAKRIEDVMDVVFE
ncbi:MAG: Lon family ATP-dependent protease [Clostridia bacterium]|nr:Lon family ATP-dependent protease [Clostridia bacterium]